MKAMQLKGELANKANMPSSKMVRLNTFQIVSKDKSLDQMSDSGFDIDKVQSVPASKLNISGTSRIEYKSEDVKSVNSAGKAKTKSQRLGPINLIKDQIVAN